MKFCTLASGSNGNCTYISDGQTHILIDAGISNRAISTELGVLGVSLSDIDAVLITHEHTDHVRGLATLLKRHTDVKIYATESTAGAISQRVNHFEGRELIFCSGERLQIGSMTIDTFSTPHDTPQSVGYRIGANGKSAMIATDLGYVPDSVMEYMDGVDILLIEANYDDKKLQYGSYPYIIKKRIAGEHGHLSNDVCASCVCRAVETGTKTVLLGHLSEENNTPRLAYETVHRKLVEQGIIPGVDMMLSVAPRGCRGELYEIE